MRLSSLIIAGALFVAAPISAQSGDSIPREYRPPPGMCRIWLNDVPPNRQPEPTDCPTAIRKRPPNGRVVFGEDVRRGEDARRGVRDEPAKLPEGVRQLRGRERDTTKQREKEPERKPEARSRVRRPPVLPPPGQSRSPIPR